MRIVAIDPGNDATGIALYEDGVLLFSEVLCPWTEPPADEVGDDRIDRLYVEVPQSGTHDSRGGVHFAAGMVVGLLASYGAVTRSRVTKVTPNQWRRGLDLLTKGVGKPYYVLEARKVPGAERVEDHNEAEAILIGKYACLMEGCG